MIVYDVATKVLDTEQFPQHNIAGLISGITFIFLFQSGKAFTMEGNAHTHTHTRTHTLPGTAVYECQVDKGEVLPRHRYKETIILLVNTVAFF